jgi:hypothetical protein
MLKLYLCKVKYELRNKDQVMSLESDANYVIRDEEVAVPTTKELGAYTDTASRAYPYSCDMRKTRKGTKAIYWTWNGVVYAKEWIAPDAKLVMYIDYEESWCSMKRLMELPAPDVIAYLKQEGLNLTMPS